MNIELKHLSQSFLSLQNNNDALTASDNDLRVRMDSPKHTSLPANSQLQPHQLPVLYQRRCLLYASGDASGSLAAGRCLNVATVVGITVCVVAAAALIVDVVVHQVIKYRQTAALNQAYRSCDRFMPRVRYVLKIVLINKKQMDTNGFYLKTNFLIQSETRIQTLGQARESVAKLPSGICERHAKPFFAKIGRAHV